MRRPQLLMKFFFIILKLTRFCTSDNPDPLSPSARVFHYFAWYPGNNTILTRVKSSMIVPAPPSGPNGLQSLWPGLQPSNAELVFQNVVSNQQPGVWGQYLIECCKPLNSYTPYIQLYIGDSVTADFVLDVDTGNWTVGWSIGRGTAGLNANADLQNGSITDIRLDTPDPLDHIFFSIELGSGAQWEFGPLVWQNITMEANTSDITWCRNPSFTPMKFNLTGPIVGIEVAGNSSRCNIPQLVFISPT